MESSDILSERTRLRGAAGVGLDKVHTEQRLVRNNWTGPVCAGRELRLSWAELGSACPVGVSVCVCLSSHCPSELQEHQSVGVSARPPYWAVCGVAPGAMEEGKGRRRARMQHLENMLSQISPFFAFCPPPRSCSPSGWLKSSQGPRTFLTICDTKTKSALCFKAVSDKDEFSLKRCVLSYCISALFRIKASEQLEPGSPPTPPAHRHFVWTLMHSLAP